MPEVGRNALLENVAFDFLQRPCLYRSPEAAGVDGDQDVGRAGNAFALDPFDQHVGIALQDTDLDARLDGEGIVELLVGVVMAGGVDVDRVRDRDGGKQQRDREPAEAAHTND